MAITFPLPTSAKAQDKAYAPHTILISVLASGLHKAEKTSSVWIPLQCKCQSADPVQQRTFLSSAVDPYFSVSDLHSQKGLKLFF